jgi:hypothetical protein
MTRNPILNARSTQIGYTEGSKAFDMYGNPCADYDESTGLLRDAKNDGILGYISLKNIFVGPRLGGQELFFGMGAVGAPQLTAQRKANHANGGPRSQPDQFAVQEPFITREATDAGIWAISDAHKVDPAEASSTKIGFPVASPPLADTGPESLNGESRSVPHTDAADASILAISNAHNAESGFPVVSPPLADMGPLPRHDESQSLPHSAEKTSLASLDHGSFGDGDAADPFIGADPKEHSALDCGSSEGQLNTEKLVAGEDPPETVHPASDDVIVGEPSVSSLDNQVDVELEAEQRLDIEPQSESKSAEWAELESEKSEPLNVSDHPMEPRGQWQQGRIVDSPPSELTAFGPLSDEQPEMAADLEERLQTGENNEPADDKVRGHALSADKMPAAVEMFMQWAAVSAGPSIEEPAAETAVSRPALVPSVPADAIDASMPAAPKDEQYAGVISGTQIRSHVAELIALIGRVTSSADRDHADGIATSSAPGDGASVERLNSSDETAAAVPAHQGNAGVFDDTDVGGQVATNAVGDEALEIDHRGIAPPSLSPGDDSVGRQQAWPGSFERADGADGTTGRVSPDQGDGEVFSDAEPDQAVQDIATNGEGLAFGEDDAMTIPCPPRGNVTRSKQDDGPLPLDYVQSSDGATSAAPTDPADAGGFSDSELEGEADIATNGEGVAFGEDDAMATMSPLPENVTRSKQDNGPLPFEGFLHSDGVTGAAASDQKNIEAGSDAAYVGQGEKKIATDEVFAIDGNASSVDQIEGLASPAARDWLKNSVGQVLRMPVVTSNDYQSADTDSGPETFDEQTKPDLVSVASQSNKDERSTAASHMDHLLKAVLRQLDQGNS